MYTYVSSSWLGYLLQTTCRIYYPTVQPQHTLYQHVESTTLLSNHTTHYINNCRIYYPTVQSQHTLYQQPVESITLLSNHNTHYQQLWICAQVLIFIP